MIYRQPDPEIHGFMTQAELQWLYEQAKQMNTIVEVGSLKGRSTQALCSGCKGTVVAVDLFQDMYPIDETLDDEINVYRDFLRNTSMFKNLMVVKMDSLMAAWQFKNQQKTFDMVFLDGDHSREGFLADLEAWGPLATKLLCGHDYGNSKTPEISIVINEMEREFDLPVETIWRAL